jgi:hypothetical protein
VAGLAAAVKEQHRRITRASDRVADQGEPSMTTEGDAS